MAQVTVLQDCQKWDESLYESLPSLSLKQPETPEFTSEEYAKILLFSYQQERDLYSSHPDVLKLRKELTKVASQYARNEEDLISKLEDLREMRQANINKLGNLTHSFRFVKKSTTTISLINACLEFIYGIGSYVTRKFVDGELDSKLPMLTLGVVGGISIAGSILALTYTKQASEGIFRDMKKEKILLRELEVIFRKGNWIDKELEELFPYYIDLKLIENFDSNKFASTNSWKENVFVAIVWSNLRRDKSLTNDEKFLTLVKVLVESSAARMWFNRMRLRKLLNDLTKSLDNLLKKKNVAGNEVFLNHAALNLYPIFFPLFYESGNMDNVRIFCSSAAAISAVCTLRKSDDKEFQEMKSIYLTLRKENKQVRKMSNDFVDQYD